MQELCLISLGYIYLAFNGIYYIYNINIFIYIIYWDFRVHVTQLRGPSSILHVHGPGCG